MKNRIRLSQLLIIICHLGWVVPTMASQNGFVINNQCAIMFLQSQAIFKANIPQPVLQKSERIQIEGMAGPLSAEKIADIHLGLIQTSKQLEAIGLKVPVITHVVLNPDSKESPVVFPYALFRLREERLIYLNGNSTQHVSQNGLQRIVANHEMIHVSMASTFSRSARVNSNGLLREAFANFLSYHFDEATYRKEAAYHSTNLEYDNEYNMGAPRRGPPRKFNRPSIWGNDHIDGAILGHFLLRMRNIIGPERMNLFLREFIPALNRFKFSSSLRADVEIKGGDGVSWGKEVADNYHDLLLSLALIDRMTKREIGIQRLLAEFCVTTEAKMSLERLHEIASQLVEAKL